MKSNYDKFEPNHIKNEARLEEDTDEACDQIQIVTRFQLKNLKIFPNPINMLKLLKQEIL